MSRPSVGSLVPHSWPLRNSSTVSQLPLQAAPDPSARSTATMASPMPMAREASGSSMPPSRRSGACGEIRRASHMLSRASTSIAAKPMANSAICAHRRTAKTSRRPSASYHITSVMRFTAPPSSPSTSRMPTKIAPIVSQRLHGTLTSATGGIPRPPSSSPPFCRPRRPRAASSMGVTLRSSRGKGRPSRRASASCWRRWSSSSSLSNQLDMCGACYPAWGERAPVRSEHGQPARPPGRG